LGNAITKAVDRFKVFEYSQSLNMDEQEPKPERERGWCNGCGQASLSDESAPPDVLICPNCGGEMKSLEDLNKSELRAFRFQEWSSEVYQEGKFGPSPGGAASELGCDRSMIDKLTERGILEKSVYDRDGHYVVMISDRSIKKAKANKAKRGKWTDTGED
jgi:hypothetical protein